jgi:hypothetical protein
VEARLDILDRRLTDSCSDGELGLAYLEQLARCADLRRALRKRVRLLMLAPWMRRRWSM